MKRAWDETDGLERTKLTPHAMEDRAASAAPVNFQREEWNVPARLPKDFVSG